MLPMKSIGLDYGEDIEQENIVKDQIYDYSDEQLDGATLYITPRREISVIVTEEGYYPKSFSIFKGEKVRFFVTSTTDKPSCFIVDGKKMFLAANKGKITEAEVEFNDPGVYKFYCPSGKIKGRLTVVERPDAVNKIERKIASNPLEKKSRYWMPKEF